MTDAPTVSLTLHDLTPDQVAAVMAVVTGDVPAAKSAAKPKASTKAAPKKEAPKKEAPKKEEPKKEEPKEEPAGDPTREDVKAALTTFREEHGQDEAVKIIKKFAKSISSIPEENFQEVLDLCAADTPLGEEEWD